MTDLARGGVIVVDKPAGLTSMQVVARIRRALGGAKLGHTGTLDPIATGVLPICIGEATKLVAELTADDKLYDAEALLGVETDTLDADGAVTRRAPELAAAVTEAQVAAWLTAHVGPLVQTPPMYSAVKVDGQRLHVSARAGQEVERPTREIVIKALTLQGFAHGRVRFQIHCSKGTYVRTLIDDLGRDLGCGAHMSALRRLQSGQFAIGEAVALEAIQPETVAGLLVPLETVCARPRVVIDAEREACVRSGFRLGADVMGVPPEVQEFQLVTADGWMLCLAHQDAGLVFYDRVFALPAARSLGPAANPPTMA